MNVVIPMAGAGSRFEAAGYTLPKPFIPIHGKAMIECVIENLAMPNARYLLLCRTEHFDFVAKSGLCKRNDVALIPIVQGTEGAACTVLRAEGFIDNEQPLLIANSDQHIEFDRSSWNWFTKHVDAAIMTFESNEPKWSYSLEENGRVVRVAEKEVISDRATVGVYYFRQGRHFVKGARQMISKNARVNGEFYVCPVYNELVSEITVRNFDVDRMLGLGTPEDFERNQDFVAKCA